MRRMLHLVTSGTQSLQEVVDIVRKAGEQIDFLHIREKHRSARELVDWVITLSAVFPVERIIVNDRVDVCAACECGGVHLAYHSLPTGLARKVICPLQRIGRSTHSIEEAEEAARDGVDYLFYGHVYASRSKPDLAPRGTAELSRIIDRYSLPIIAIGGIKPHHVPELMKIGCAGIAVLSGITDATDPGGAAREYRRALDLAMDES